MTMSINAFSPSQPLLNPALPKNEQPPSNNSIQNLAKELVQISQLHPKDQTVAYEKWLQKNIVTENFPLLALIVAELMAKSTTDTPEKKAIIALFKHLSAFNIQMCIENIKLSNRDYLLEKILKTWVETDGEPAFQKIGQIFQAKWDKHPYGATTGDNISINFLAIEKKDGHKWGFGFDSENQSTVPVDTTKTDINPQNLLKNEEKVDWISNGYRRAQVDIIEKNVCTNDSVTIELIVKKVHVKDFALLRSTLFDQFPTIPEDIWAPCFVNPYSDKLIFNDNAELTISHLPSMYSNLQTFLDHQFDTWDNNTFHPDPPDQDMSTLNNLIRDVLNDINSIQDYDKMNALLQYNPDSSEESLLLVGTFRILLSHTDSFKNDFLMHNRMQLKAESLQTIENLLIKKIDANNPSAGMKEGIELLKDAIFDHCILKDGTTFVPLYVGSIVVSEKDEENQ